MSIYVKESDSVNSLVPKGINLGVDKDAQWNGEYLQGKKVYIKMVECGALPNKTSKVIGGYIPNGVTLDYIWIDVSNSFAFNNGAKYPIPYADNNSVNSISVKLTGYGKSITISTNANWSMYASIVTVKYTIK